MNSIPEPGHYDAKEVFAFTGLSLYGGQVLEKGLVNLLMALYTDGLRVTKADYDSVFSKHDRQTLGKLLRQAQSIYPFMQQDADLLQEALAKRNHLVHNFFADNAAAFVTEVGIRNMLNELREMIQCFQEADKVAQNIYLPIFERLGVTEKSLENTAEQMVEKFLANT